MNREDCKEKRRNSTHQIRDFVHSVDVANSVQFNPELV